MIGTLTSCKEETPEEKMARMGMNYFSVKQYLYDQMRTYNGGPISIIQTNTQNGKTDTVYTNSEKMDWTGLVSTFSEADISDAENLGHYDFSQYEDKEDRTINFYYQAKDDYLFTRKLLISADMYTNHIKAIYIETLNHSLIFGDTNEKLYYSSYARVQVQVSKSPLIGARKYTVNEYKLIH
jgi:hypothetical protein